VIVDIAMPHLNGLEASRHLKQKMPRIRVIFLTMNHDPELAFEAIRAGASGYVLKDSGPSELFSTIEEALKGRTYVTPQIAPGMLEVFIRGGFERGWRHKALSPRQREVLRVLEQLLVKCQILAASQSGTRKKRKFRFKNPLLSLDATVIAISARRCLIGPSFA
jgi:DNA-binding NarL/FixJ family response regulator